MGTLTLGGWVPLGVPYGGGTVEAVAAVIEAVGLCGDPWSSRLGPPGAPGCTAPGGSLAGRPGSTWQLLGVTWPRPTPHLAPGLALVRRSPSASTSSRSASRSSRGDQAGGRGDRAGRVWSIRQGGPTDLPREPGRAVLPGPPRATTLGPPGVPQGDGRPTPGGMGGPRGGPRGWDGRGGSRGD